MEINFNPNVAPLNRAAGMLRALPPGGGADGVLFSQSEALNMALAREPEIRADRVEEAREKISSVPYPPPETLRSIATLLAMNLDQQDRI